jgi:carbon-monoxide dehydrogenase medium subunit
MRLEYLEPQSVEEVVSLLSKYNGKAKIIAGGTDLVVQMRDKAINLEYLIDITCITGLDYISYDEKRGLMIGALVPVRTLERSIELRQRYPVICQAASQLGSVAIRNVATIGGNLCNAAPSAESAPALIGLSARAKIVGPDGERVVALEDFFTGPGSTVLKKGELLAEIQVPVLLPNTRGIYLKHSMRGTVDLFVRISR